MKMLLFLVFAAASALTSIAQGPIVRARLEPAKDIIVGQPVKLVVTVLVPNYFAGSPDFPELEIENAIVVLPQDRPQNSNEQIGSSTYAGITETYTIYSQQSGDFRIRPAEISVKYANAPPNSTVAHVPLPSISFHADVPAAARGLDYFLPTTRLTMTQKWSSPLTRVRAGDSVTRTITVTASRMQAMLVPPLPMSAPDGIRVYQSDAAVEDRKSDRGEFLFGRRTQSAQYLIQKAGDYTLPAVELKWWNLATNRLVTATLPAVHFTALPGPAAVTELPPAQEVATTPPPKPLTPWKKYRHWAEVFLPIGLALVLLGWMAYRFVPRLYRRLVALNKVRKQSERAYFSSLRRSCQAGDARETYHWLLKWLARFHPGVSLQGFLVLANDQTLTAEIDRVTALLFTEKAGAGDWNGKPLWNELKRYRVSCKKISYSPDLAPLNPR